MLARWGERAFCGLHTLLFGDSLAPDSSECAGDCPVCAYVVTAAAWVVAGWWWGLMWSWRVQWRRHLPWRTEHLRRRMWRQRPVHEALRRVWWRRPVRRPQQRVPQRLRRRLPMRFALRDLRRYNGVRAPCKGGVRMGWVADRVGCIGCRG